MESQVNAPDLTTARALAEYDFASGHRPQDTSCWHREEAEAYEETWLACVDGSN